MKQVVLALQPEFEQRPKLVVDNDTAGALQKRIRMAKFSTLRW